MLLLVRDDHCKQQKKPSQNKRNSHAKFCLSRHTRLQQLEVAATVEGSTQSLRPSDGRDYCLGIADHVREAVNLANVLNEQVQGMSCAVKSVDMGEPACAGMSILMHIATVKPLICPA